MAELVRRENDLAALEIYLDVAGRGGPRIAFDVGRGRERFTKLRVDPRDLGIPHDFDGGSWRYGEPQLTLPPGLVSDLDGPIRDAVAGDARLGLWLQLSSPAGFLPLFPWERLLRPGLEGLPILRVPNFVYFPPLGDGPIDIVLLLSEPMAKRPFSGPELLLHLARTIAKSIPSRPTIHVFTDRPTYQNLAGRAASTLDLGDAGELRLHDPAKAPDTTVQGYGQVDDRSGAVTNPWLAWIVDEMAGKTVEAVHVVSHAYLSGDQAALALAASPMLNDDRRWARFIGPNQLAGFLTGLGAWAVGLTSPPGNFSPMGTRLFADHLAHQRAGPIALHELEFDPDATDLGNAYFDLFTRGRPPGSSSVALYCHPRQWLDTSPGDEPQRGFAESIVYSSMRPAPAAAADPYATLTRRYLEQSAARLFPDADEPATAQDRAAGEGVRQALAFVDQVLGGSWGAGGAGDATAGGATATARATATATKGADAPDDRADDDRPDDDREERRPVSRA